MRLPPPPPMKPLTLSWLKLMWSPHPQKHQKSAKPLIPPLLFLSLLPVPNSTIMLSTGLRSRSQSQDCQGFQVLHQHLAPSTSMASGQTTRSSIAPGTPTQGNGYHLIGSGAILSEAITPAFCTIKTHMWEDATLIVQNAGVIASLRIAPEPIRRYSFP